ncbi:hypothetical protein A9200_00370 [Maribacter hydrothermalis]|uniref:Lipoprotein n=2 Tax=Maribacter hydrothermalis TaxID=1836467 RepID=A0A1B7ZE80_9FLAO|nr:hypothetical protein BTR34_08725 [Maribacter hydrothermalis]OBR41879.1 hypothetical protein A9200_00370 [Maribacter hydrothermalis]
MGLMKYITSSFFVLLLFLTSCTSQKKMQTKTPFKIGNATSQQYIGGREESRSGTELRIPLSFSNTIEIKINHVFFRGKEAQSALDTLENEKVLVVKMPNDLIESSEAINLKLKFDEAVISYNENGETKYAKVQGIKQKQPLIYKSAPKN